MTVLANSSADRLHHPVAHASYAGASQLLRPTSVAKRWRRQRRTAHCSASLKSADAEHIAVDPEAKFKRYGAHFGGKYSLDLGELMDAAPRVRIRQSSDRQKALLAELALVNERLAGKESWEIRHKLEHLKSKRKTWEMIYQYVTKLDATTTLARIEEASSKVTLQSKHQQDKLALALLLLSITGVFGNLLTRCCLLVGPRAAE